MFIESRLDAKSTKERIIQYSINRVLNNAKSIRSIVNKLSSPKCIWLICFLKLCDGAQFSFMESNKGSLASQIIIKIN